MTEEQGPGTTDLHRRGTAGAPGAPPSERDPQAWSTTPWTLADLVRGVLVGLLMSFVPLIVVFTINQSVALRGTALLALTGISLYLSLGLGVWIFALRRHGVGLRAAGFERVRTGAIIWMIPVAFGALMLNGLVVLGMRALFDEVPTVQDQVLGDGAGQLGAPDLVWLLLVGSVAAPFVEEFLFRGLAFRYVRSRYGFLPTAAVTSILFALAHLSPKLIAPLFVFGLVLALVTERYRSIYPAVVLHSLNNGFAMVALYASLS